MPGELVLPATGDKQAIFTAVKSFLGECSLGIAAVDNERPWGGFFVIEEADTDRFVEQFYPGYNVEKIRKFGSKLMPKILVVGPGEELSWQYHHRRAELWRCIVGPVGYVRSHDDTLGISNILMPGKTVQFDPQERHRLQGRDNWGVVAEFWQHTDPQHPSTEEDIVRLQDRYGR